MSAKTASPTSSPGRARLHSDVLARYGDADGPRELRCLHLADGTRLVVDWRMQRRADARLVGSLAVEEPRENACLLAELYVADASRGCCRRLCAADLQGASASRPDVDVEPVAELRDDADAAYALVPIPCGKSYAVLRWTRRAARDREPRPLCLREVISQLQAYEPARSITLRALTCHDGDSAVSVARLREELARVETSPIVLNRALREAVLAHAEHGTSLSEIALRCGRTKRGRDGGITGETSWLTRRIGVRPEGGESAPTPWIHSDVLALIARQGLGVSPLEVEAA
ncbi:MAG TPA: hypothetical protein VK707_07240 [Solirubrobacteraceae bacterium]|jgi:hypothetical protein|nr:hypothetical protein [Solirubrobacteraceae bacterium]